MISCSSGGLICLHGLQPAEAPRRAIPCCTIYFVCVSSFGPVKWIRSRHSSIHPAITDHPQIHALLKLCYLFFIFSRVIFQHIHVEKTTDTPPILSCISPNQIVSCRPQRMMTRKHKGAAHLNINPSASHPRPSSTSCRANKCMASTMTSAIGAGGAIAGTAGMGAAWPSTEC